MWEVRILNGQKEKQTEEMQYVILNIDMSLICQAFLLYLALFTHMPTLHVFVTNMTFLVSLNNTCLHQVSCLAWLLYTITISQKVFLCVWLEILLIINNRHAFESTK